VKRISAKSKRAKIEATLAKYEAMNPDELDAQQSNFRSLAIRALKIELALQDKGFVEKDGWMTPAPKKPAKRTRRPRPPRT
jgi:hypothetical protein